MKRIDLQPAYVLHRRSYRETSIILELYTPEFGRLSAVAKGVRKARSASQGLLQPFTPILISCAGKGELLTLTQVEVNTRSDLKRLNGECLFAGFYLNELLISLLQKWDAHSGLFAAYENALLALQSAYLEQKTLRAFEKYLLEALGYGLLPKDAALQYLPDRYYRFIPEQGFSALDTSEHLPTVSNVFSGKSLLAIAQEDWQDETCLQDAKRLTRFILAPLLGAKQINSRKLFLNIESQTNDE